MDTPETQFCNGTDCLKFKPSTEFHIYRPNVCKKCHSKQSQKSKAKRIATLKEKNEPRECVECKTVKPFANFPSSTTTAVCKPCTSRITSERVKLIRLKVKALDKENRDLKDKLIESLTEQVKTLKLSNGAGNTTSS